MLLIVARAFRSIVLRLLSFDKSAMIPQYTAMAQLSRTCWEIQSRTRSTAGDRLAMRESLENLCWEVQHIAVELEKAENQLHYVAVWWTRQERICRQKRKRSSTTQWCFPYRQWMCPHCTVKHRNNIWFWPFFSPSHLLEIDATRIWILFFMD